MEPGVGELADGETETTLQGQPAPGSILIHKPAARSKKELRKRQQEELVQREYEAYIEDDQDLMSDPDYQLI
jgi:hypothetical protein